MLCNFSYAAKMKNSIHVPRISEGNYEEHKIKCIFWWMKELNSQRRWLFLRTLSAFFWVRFSNFKVFSLVWNQTHVKSLVLILTKNLCKQSCYGERHKKPESQYWQETSDSFLLQPTMTCLWQRVSREQALDFMPNSCNLDFKTWHWKYLSFLL